MANENKNVDEIIEEVKEEQKPADQAPANADAAPADNTPDKKVAVTVPKWLVKTARVIEGIAAAFGAVVAGLMIRDTVVKKKHKKHYVSAPARPREIPYHPYVEPAAPSVSEDIKVDTF